MGFTPVMKKESNDGLMWYGSETKSSFVKNYSESRKLKVTVSYYGVDTSEHILQSKEKKK